MSNKKQTGQNGMEAFGVMLILFALLNQALSLIVFACAKVAESQVLFDYSVSGLVVGAVGWILGLVLSCRLGVE